MPCTCSPSARCPYAWDLRDQLRDAPVDGTPDTAQARHRIALTYTRHLEAAHAPWHHHGGLLWPIWHPRAYPDPRLTLKED
jgi:hypothetical protein